MGSTRECIDLGTARSPARASSAFHLTLSALQNDLPGPGNYNINGAASTTDISTLMKVCNIDRAHETSAPAHPVYRRLEALYQSGEQPQ